MSNTFGESVMSRSDEAENYVPVSKRRTKMTNKQLPEEHATDFAGSLEAEEARRADQLEQSKKP